MSPLQKLAPVLPRYDQTAPLGWIKMLSDHELIQVLDRALKRSLAEHPEDYLDLLDWHRKSCFGLYNATMDRN